MQEDVLGVRDGNGGWRVENTWRQEALLYCPREQHLPCKENDLVDPGEGSSES